jgi:hypothetical protein
VVLGECATGDRFAARGQDWGGNDQIDVNRADDQY